ncbi:BclA C-terminal domain-containing protein, partial [Priestia megaterium]
PTGATGVTGPTGPTGATGVTGPTGPTGEIVTNNSMFACNTTGSVIPVALGGSNSIPLPNNQNLDGFIANGPNTIFTVPATGRYYITYQINTTAALGVGAGSRILLNSTTPIPGSILSPVLSTSTFNNDVIVNLSAGNTISLQLFSSILLIATLLSAGGSVGAALTIIRLQ